MIAKILFKATGVLILCGAILAGWTWMDYGQSLKTPLDTGGEALTYVIEPGTSLNRVSRDLAQRGVLAQPRYLVWYARWNDLGRRIKAGEYLIPAGATPVEMLELFVSGRVVERPFTVVEGWTFADLLAAVRADDRLENASDGLDEAGIMERLGHPEQHPEGRFLPDTYNFPRGTTDLALLRRAHADMATFLAEAWATRPEGLPYETPDEVLTMASIVEKETSVPAERPEIAGVFVRRLHKGMRLETDPTVIYGLGDQFDGNLRRRDLRTDTPYNTYTRKGLPPTPIALPGRAAIRAALNPADGKALFFVAKGDGSHHFSATYEEHRKAVRKYQLSGRRRSGG